MDAIEKLSDAKMRKVESIINGNDMKDNIETHPEEVD